MYAPPVPIRPVLNEEPNFYSKAIPFNCLTSLSTQRRPVPSDLVDGDFQLPPLQFAPLAPSAEREEIDCSSFTKEIVTLPPGLFSTSPSPSTESMQKVKLCPRSKKLLNSQRPVEVQTIHQNKPSPLCRKPLHSQSPEGLQNSSKSPVPLEKPGPLSKKRGFIRDAEET